MSREGKVLELARLPVHVLPRFTHLYSGVKLSTASVLEGYLRSDLCLITWARIPFP